MPFPAARDNLDDPRRTALDALLSEWNAAPGVPPFADANLRAEHGAPTSEITNYIVLLSDNSAALNVAPPGPRAMFEQLGEASALSGHDAAPLRALVLGRAVMLTKYARYLAPRLDALGCFDTDDQIRASLRSLSGLTEVTAPANLEVYFSAVRLTPLGRGATFATFATPPDVNHRPWVVPIPSGNEVRDSLGLGEDPDGSDYILFAYRVSDTAALRAPTTASSGWFYQRWFRPSAAAETDLHGWTAPLSSTYNPRPEVVHSEIDGSTLVTPMYIVNA